MPGGGERHRVQVAIAHEADQDAAGVVVPGNAGHHGYFQVGVGGGALGGRGLLRFLRLLGPFGGGRLRLAREGFWFRVIRSVGRWLVLGGCLILAGPVFLAGLSSADGWSPGGGWSRVAWLWVAGFGFLGGLLGRDGRRRGRRDRIVAPLPDAAGRGLGGRGERGRGERRVGGQVTGAGRTGRDGSGPARPGRRYPGRRRSRYLRGWDGLRGWAGPAGRAPAGLGRAPARWPQPHPSWACRSAHASWRPRLCRAPAGPRHSRQSRCRRAEACS